MMCDVSQGLQVRASTQHGHSGLNSNAMGDEDLSSRR